MDNCRGTPGSPADEELMVRFRDYNDGDAFEILFLRYGERLRNFVRKYVNDAETARDLVQEIFIRVAKSRDSYKPTARFSSWIYRIAANLAINTYKAQQIRGWISLDEAITGDLETSRILDNLAAQETAREVLHAAASLPSKQGAAFENIVLRGHSYEYAAEQLGCSIGTVKSRVYHARRKIKEALRKEVHI